MPDELAEDLVRTMNEVARAARADGASARRKSARCAQQFQVDIDRYKGLKAELANRSIARGARAIDQPRPELPKPPAPRSVAAKSATTSSATCTTGTTNSCAMRSPGCTFIRLAAAIPAGHHQRALIIRIDQAREIA